HSQRSESPPSLIFGITHSHTAPPRRHIELRHLPVAVSQSDVESLSHPSRLPTPPQAPYPNLGTTQSGSSSRPYPCPPKQCYGSPRPVLLFVALVADVHQHLLFNPRLKSGPVTPLCLSSFAPTALLGNSPWSRWLSFFAATLFIE